MLHASPDLDQPQRLALTVYSPAGVVADAGSLGRATRRLQALGFDARLDTDARARRQRFAGGDDVRLAALHRVAEAAPSVALASRGGYGLTRLLDQIRWPLLARSVERGTRWVGYSDLTVLQLAAMAHGAAGPERIDRHAGAGGWWAGPMACGDFGNRDLEGGGDDVTQQCFLEAMQGELEAVGFRTDAGFDGLHAKGVLWGGNLSLVLSLLGTKHAPRVRGGILFLEDVNEHPYRIERGLLQLHQAGVLATQKAVLLGDFGGWRKSPLDRGYGLRAVVAHLRSLVRTPILTGLPFGHVPTKVCLPLARRVQLFVEGREALLLW